MKWGFNITFITFNKRYNLKGTEMLSISVPDKNILVPPKGKKNQQSPCSFIYEDRFLPLFSRMWDGYVKDISCMLSQNFSFLVKKDDGLLTVIKVQAIRPHPEKVGGVFFFSPLFLLMQEYSTGQSSRFQMYSCLNTSESN